MSLSFELSKNNAFTPNFCTLTGEIRKPAKQTPYQRTLERQRTAAEARDFVLRNVKNGIHVTTQAESDRTRSITPRRLVG